MPNVVLIHTCLDDDHALTVAKHLRDDLCVEVEVLAREQCHDGWRIEGTDDEVLIETAAGRRYTSADIRSVYLRRDYVWEPAWLPPNELTVPAREFLAEQRSFHVESLLRRLAASCPFVNGLDANRRAGSKLLQQHLARQCGLSVPRTYVGNNPGLAEAFVRALWAEGRRCCTKNIESTQVSIGGVKHARLTQVFAESDLPALAGLPLCPMIFQAYVEKRYEYRVTVVGEEVYACRIDSQRPGGRTSIDWRHYDVPRTPHHAARLGDDLTRRLVRLVRQLGLTYGAVDLVEDPEGEFWFLEVNSMGQWLWVEDLTELPISMAVARHLADPSLIVRRTTI